MALKPVYTIDGERWLPLGRAATLLGTSTAMVKRWMGDGVLDWRQLRPGSKSLLVAERDVQRLRLARGVGEKERLARATQATRTADQRGRSMLWVPTERDDVTGAAFGVFDRTWDPAPVATPISGRKSVEGTRE